MLAREGGASIKEIVDLTGWKANSVHSALSTLRASGRIIVVEQVEQERRYRLAAA
ncbi:DUF3489 domain-containing protein [Novosphingopyxis iocasae]|uniref:DUF3489 domain-containing protein n=1 Tax=Novosphingopyxis iocasae TaxID=2762729 RepID=UPI001651A509|nr:DUF3489 domain-containing protein [Novosphingopyxis iocasae]